MAAFYRATLADFLWDDPARILGFLTAATQHSELQRRQIKAWELEIEVLKASYGNLVRIMPDASRWALLLEYPIPRRQKRLDAVLLADDVIFCIEFKTEDKAHTQQPQRQVEDYALDLRDFHEASGGRRIVPVVVVPKAPAAADLNTDVSIDTVRRVRLANATDFEEIIVQAFKADHQPGCQPVDAETWDYSAYRPVPTIIEAAE